MRSFEYRHVISFEETNLTGNVYYVSHVRWQGRCREMFLREHAPSIVRELEQGLALITLRCSCQYLAELSAMDEITVRMTLAELLQNRLRMTFEYWRTSRGREEELVARGEQEIASMRREGKSLVPQPFSAAFAEALRPFLPR